jgi:hypothetical protein
MTRIFGADILDELEEIAEDNLNTMLQTIRTTRSDTTLQDIREISFGNVKRNFPELVITLFDSETKNEELNIDIADTPEEYPVQLRILFKSTAGNEEKQAEYYIEALQRIYHGYKSDDISWITVEGGIRGEAYDEMRETFKVAGISATVRIY